MTRRKHNKHYAAIPAFRVPTQLQVENLFKRGKKNIKLDPNPLKAISIIHQRQPDRIFL